jgi:protocatechuate 3,4-dioxygenase beta subunit
LLLVGAESTGAQSGSAPTRSTHPGPEYQDETPSTAHLWEDGDPGQRLHLRGRVISTSGAPLAGAEIVLWQADGAGSYHPERYRARLISRENGEFRVTTALPGTHYGLKHIHVMLTHPDYQPLTTRILFRGDPMLDPEDEDLAILLEEVRNESRTVLVGNVQFVLAPI